ncbi:MAG: hypothetical protein QG646_848 [Euryarchaeota archaeon]|nr:hypothetical protein [Euryarchaeota archaeon]
MLMNQCIVKYNSKCATCGCSLTAQGAYSSSSYATGSQHGETSTTFRFCSKKCEILFEINFHAAFMGCEESFSHLVHDHGYSPEELFQAIGGKICSLSTN